MAFVCNHLHLRSEDPDNAAKFYVDNFGAEIVSTRPLSNTISHTLELNGQPLLTVSGEAEGENAVPGSTHPRFRPGPLRFPDRQYSGGVRALQGQWGQHHLRSVDHAVRVPGDVRGGARQGQPGNHPASRLTRRTH